MQAPFKIGDKVKLWGKYGTSFPLLQDVLKCKGYATVSEMFEQDGNWFLRFEECRGVTHSQYAKKFKRLGEVDPNGMDPHEPGAKLDGGKVLAAQILAQFPRALIGVAEVGTFGANKYTMGGWLAVPNGIVRYADAKIRHWLARARGEEFDKESKLHHLKHEAWNVLAELELTLREEEKASASSN